VTQDYARGGQWVICYRPFSESGFRVFRSAYTVLDIQRGINECRAAHVFSEVWASPAGRAMVAESEPSDPAG
jgi:hypothetical protein